MILIKETSGDTLTGAIDGVNLVYATTYDFVDGEVSVYVNGLRKVDSLDDGFTLTSPRTVTLKEPLLSGDSLEVEYKSPMATGGGAPGGVPSAPQIVDNVPALYSLENTPSLIADDLDPTLFSEGEHDVEILADDLKPVIMTPQEG